METPIPTYIPDPAFESVKLIVSAAELIELVQNDPDWVEKNATAIRPVEVHGYCDLEKSPIRRLSPFIIFRGETVEMQKAREKYEAEKFPASKDYPKQVHQRVASFKNCPNLENADGVFDGHVSFYECAIREIGPGLTVFPDEHGDTATFAECMMLEIVRGTFHGGVSFNGSGIHTIDTENLRITRPNNRGIAASFAGCLWLHTLSGKYPGKVNANNSRIREIAKDFEVTQPDSMGKAGSFMSCKNLKTARGKFHGDVNFEGCPITTVTGLTLTDPDRQYVNLQNCENLRDCQMDILTHPNTKIEPEKRAKLIAHKRARIAMKGGTPTLELME